jgi:hypothetical protein
LKIGVNWVTITNTHIQMETANLIFKNKDIFSTEVLIISYIGAYGVRTLEFFSSHCDDLGPFFLKKKKSPLDHWLLHLFLSPGCDNSKKKRNTDAEFRDARLQYLLAQTTTGVFRRHKAQRSAKRRREESGT